MAVPMITVVDANLSKASLNSLNAIGGVVGGIGLCVLVTWVVGRRVRECFNRSWW